MWMTSLPTIFSGISAIVSVIVYITVKFNDIKHIQKSVEQIEKTVTELGKTVSSDHENTQKEITNLMITMTKITVRCKERHRIKGKE